VYTSAEANGHLTLLNTKCTKQHKK